MNGNSGYIGFSYEIIRNYIYSQGGKVEYHKLIKHFKDELANPENKEARILFKDLVNQVAIVTTEGNQKFLSLRNNAIVDEPPKLPPRSNDQLSQSNFNDSRTNSFQAIANLQLYDAHQNKSASQQHFPPQQIPSSSKLMNQQFSQSSQCNYNQPNHQRLLPSIDPSMNLISNQFSNQINQPRQPFSYNLNQPVPAFLNQRINLAEMNNLDMNSVLIQPKPVPVIPQIPSLQVQMNANLMLNLNNKYFNKNEQQSQNPPLPAKNTNLWANNNYNPDCPPKAPPRRKSFASSSNTYLNKKGTMNNNVKDNENFLQSTPKQFTDKFKEINELKFNSPGRVKEHAKKLNKMVSESELKPPMPLGNNNSTNANIQNNLKDDSDLNDQIKRRWMVKSSCCDYNELQQMLKDHPKLAEFKDITSGYNAMHWAAKFNKADIIKLIAGTHNVNPNIKTFSGYTPLHLAAMFDNKEIMELLIKGYGVDASIRDYAGRTADDLLKINKKNRIKFTENSLSRKNQEPETSSKSSSLLARTASLRQTHHKLLDRLPSKYRTMK